VGISTATANGSIDNTKSYTMTRYPIVLVHGFAGFNNVGPVDYFYQVPAELRKGGAEVFVVKLSAVNSTEARGEQLRSEIQRILNATGRGKVNIIAHSHGSPTSRYVASVEPGWVASVTSVGGANAGLPMYDILLDVASQQTALGKTVKAGFEVYGKLISAVTGGGNYPQDTLASAASLSTNGMDLFNKNHPEGLPTHACAEGNYVGKNGVAYYSWSGTSIFTNPLDPSDAVMAATSLAFKGAPNDGLIGQCASHLGKVIRDNYKMNHADEINQVVGLVSPSEINPLTVYREHANRLKNAGF